MHVGRAGSYLPLLLLALVGVGGARADEPPAPLAPAAAGAPCGRAQTPEQAADAARSAVAAKEGAALASLAAQAEPDPWLVVDELIRRGEYDAAEAFAKAALRVDTEALPAYVASRRAQADDPARRERLHRSMAAFMTGAPVDAVEALGPEEAGAIQDVVGVRLAMGRGLAHRALGQLDASVAALCRSGEAAARLGWWNYAYRAWIEAGRTAYDVSDFATAREAHETALAVAERRRDPLAVAQALSGMGIVQHALGDFAKALALQERALAAFEALGDKAGIGRTWGSVGVIHYRRGDYAKALAAYEQALAAQEALGNKADAAVTQGNIGTVYHALGDHAKALATFARALGTQEALGDRAAVAWMLSNIGRAHYSLGDPKAALAALERAVRSARSLRAVPVLVDALGALARVYLAAGAPSRALGAAREALRESETLLGGLAEEEGAGARQTLGDLFGVGVLAAAGEEDVAETLTFLESGRAGALLDALGKREALRWKAESLPDELRTEEAQAQAAQRRARRAYDQAVRGGDRRATRAAAEALDAAMDDLRAVDARVQRENKRAAGLFYPRAKTLEEVVSALEEDEALVIYGLCLDRALALVVRPQAQAIVPLGRRADLEAACAALDLTHRDHDPAEALAALAKTLVEPLGLGPEVKRVLVAPEGGLGYLPFGALFDVPVALTPSGTTHAILRGEERARGEGVLALGDPDYAGTSAGAQAVYYRGRRLHPLPATRAEAEHVGTTTLLGAEATEGGLRATLPARPRWRAVHFACHGFVDPDRPTRSSLALSTRGDEDGFLTAQEVLRTKIPADLAVLSACETGKGKVVGGEGILGLTRAFMYAGTPRVLCSLWKVDDEATKALMVRFYELWNPGDPSKAMGTAAALEAAQEYVRSQERWRHPYFWAAWVLWGLPD